MKLQNIFAAPLLALALMGAAPGGPDVAVVFTPRTGTAGFEALEVALSFTGESDGDTVIALPDEWGGQRELYKAIRDLRADGAEIASGDNPATRLLRHQPGARVTLRYRVVADGEGPVIASGQNNDYRVQVAADHFFALGDAWVVQPRNISMDAQARFRLDWRPPEGMAFASDLEHAPSLLFGDVVESVMIGGDVRVIDAGGGARLAIRGAVAARNDAGWRDAFVRIAGAQRAYWRSEDEPFLVTILIKAPENPGSISVGGTGRADAFAFFTTTNAPTEKLDRVMAHEMMHTWTPRRIGRLRETPSEARDYWLSEGFTDWASMRVMARSGAWRAADFAAVFNEFVRAYDLSPVREAPNERIAADFWNLPEVSDLPYRRGMLLATYWDQRVRAATGGRKDFDDVLLWMQARARREPETPAVELLARAMRRVARIDISAELESLVEQGHAADIPAGVFGACGNLEWIERARFHRGFDIEASMAAGGVISGVIADGPAWRAGLRDGMRLVGRRGGEIGNPEIEIAYEVETDGVRQTLRWMPRGEGTERFRRLNLVADLAGPERDACQRRLGGL